MQNPSTSMIIIKLLCPNAYCAKASHSKCQSEATIPTMMLTAFPRIPARPLLGCCRPPNATPKRHTESRQTS
eukprot:scaffold195317_cov33-Tisochrysis_lutea.AAC.1